MAAADLPVAHCARCGAALFMCACEAVPTGRDVVFPFPKLPEDATPDQRLQRWCLHVAMNPAAAQFDAQRFVADMRARGLRDCFGRLRPRLEAMAAHYCQDSTEHGYREVHTLMTAHMQSPADAARYSLERCRNEVQLAVLRFLTFDWSRMNLWDVAMVNNVYQASDPAAYPLEDPDLKLGFDVVGCLMAVLKLASDRLGYAFEPFDWQ